MLLIHEVEHNKLIFNVLEAKMDYNCADDFELSVWEKIRFDANEFLNSKQYDALEVIYINIRTLIRKRDGAKINFSIVESANNKLINELKDILKDAESQLEKSEFAISYEKKHN